MHTPMPRMAQVTPSKSGGTRMFLNDNVLKMNGNLQRADYGSFERACQALVQSKHTKVEIDLTNCTYVSSLVIGILVDSITQMKADNKDVKVRVSPEVGRFLHMAHLYHLFSYDIVEPNLGR